MSSSKPDINSSGASDSANASLIRRIRVAVPPSSKSCSWIVMWISHQSVLVHRTFAWAGLRSASFTECRLGNCPRTSDAIFDFIYRRSRTPVGVGLACAIRHTSIRSCSLAKDPPLLSERVGPNLHTRDSGLSMGRVGRSKLRTQPSSVSM